MYSAIELRDIQRRKNFYNKKDVAKLLLATGVPHDKKAMMKLTALEDTDGTFNAIQESYDCLTRVVFAVHPQQINIRDKTNGQIIASITR
jgi:hypothetical protein